MTEITIQYINISPENYSGVDPAPVCTSRLKKQSKQTDTSSQQLHELISPEKYRHTKISQIKISPCKISSIPCKEK